MAAFITMAGIDTGANQTVTDVKTCPQSGLHIGAIVGVNVHCVVRTGLLGGIDELAYHLVAVRTAGVFDANADLPLGAA